MKPSYPSPLEAAKDFILRYRYYFITVDCGCYLTGSISFHRKILKLQGGGGGGGLKPKVKIFSFEEYLIEAVLVQFKHITDGGLKEAKPPAAGRFSWFFSKK